MKTDWAIQVKNISKQYMLNDNAGLHSAHIALQNICFTLNKKDRLGIIGKNGSGKSTLIKIIAGLVKPSEGEVLIADKINYLIEVGSNFIPELSGKENVVLFLNIHGVNSTTIPRLTEKIRMFADIGKYFDQSIKYYSSGMFIRLALAAGVHINAKIFVLDEVLMAGDAAFRSKISRYFKEKAQENLSLILASHNPKEIKENCNKVLWLDKGQIAFLGDTDEGLEKYNDLLAKERSEKFYFSQVMPFANTCTTFNQIPQDELENKFIKINNLEISPIAGEEITYDSGFNILLEFSKKRIEDNIHPLFKIYDSNMEAVLLIVSSNDPTAFNLLNETNKIDSLVKCQFPSKILSAGTYYLECTAGINPKPNEKHTKEAFSLKTRISFTIKSELFDFTGATHNVFIKPECKWEIV